MKMPRKALVVSLAFALVAGFTFALVQQFTPTSATGGGATMSLQISGTLNSGSVNCDSSSGTLENPTKCTVDPSSEITVEIMADQGPAEGYIAWQTQLYYTPLIYKPIPHAEEILWPESLLAVRSPLAPDGTEGVVAHGDASGLFAPFPVSTYDGALVSITINCMASGSTTLYLTTRNESMQIPPGNPAGSSYVDPDVLTILPKVIGAAPVDHDMNPDSPDVAQDMAAAIEINCGEPPTPTPGPTETPTVTPTPCPTEKVPSSGGGCGTPMPATDTPVPTDTPEATATPVIACGDVTGDGSVNSIDSTLILQFGAGLIDSVPNPDVSDVTGDELIDSRDSTVILQFSAGLLDALNCI